MERLPPVALWPRELAVSDKIYKGVAFKNKAFVIVNKSKACIIENVEIE